MNEVPAARGERTICLSIRFWTDAIAGQPGSVVPKHCWSGGVVSLDANKTHGIPASDWIPFNSLPDLNAKIEKLLIKNGIKMHAGSHEKRYRS